MDKIIYYVQNWGYLAVFLGALVEGESVILTASILASQGYMDINKIMMTAFAGTWIADQVLYLIGYYYGERFFDKFPKLRPAAERCFKLLKKWDAGFIILCRFIYGIRTTSSLVVGASGVKPRRFIPLNTISAIIWTIVSCSLGYVLGPMVIKLFHKFEKFQKYIIFGIVFVIIAIFSCFKLRKKVKSKKN